LIDRVIEVRAAHGLDLVVFDPLAKLLPGGTENNTAAMLTALVELERLTDLDLSVLLVHHPRKGECLTGQASRGSGALPAHVDILIEKYYVAKPLDSDRRRRLQAFSRYEQTPEQRIIELTADGTDYRVCPDAQAEESARFWKVVQAVLEDAARPLTRRQVLEQWPEDHQAPALLTLWRLLDHAVLQGQAQRDGTGRRNDPYRYWLPGHEARWQNNPWYRLEQIEKSDRETLRQLEADWDRQFQSRKGYKP
jgi:hypothetical protein